MKIATKITTGIATVGLLATLLAPAVFATDVSVVGNGAGSSSKVEVTNANSTFVSQTNKTESYTSIVSKANSGGNSSDFCTGNCGAVVSGDATNVVSVKVTGGSNTATLPTNCGCNNTSSVTVAGNGAWSRTNVDLNQIDSQTLIQKAWLDAWNNVVNNSNSGNNHSDFGTNWNGQSGVVSSGDATSAVSVTVQGQNNSAL